MSKDVLIWARHTRKWEIARQEMIAVAAMRELWWVRRDTSTICRVGDEVAAHPLPAKPKE
jgi:hypothetical protein